LGIFQDMRRLRYFKKMEGKFVTNTLSLPIKLNNQEKLIFDTLRTIVKDHELKTTLRVAGGWVRDKLLGKEGEDMDIDIALDDMMGQDFAQYVSQYYEEHGEEKKKFGVIKANPDQSKHLETATINIKGTWIDFVNLRTETYSADSRIPEIQFGTPEQDALRRDFTINSLFYNINEDKIEDFTQRGLEDLKNGIVDTPLAASETFADDPLRVMRAVRFTSRFRFKMQEQVITAASDSEIHEALGEKVSKERIYIELSKALMGAHPFESLSLAHACGLMPVIFKTPNHSIEELKTANQQNERFDKAIEVAEEVHEVAKLLKFSHGESLYPAKGTKEAQLIYSLCSALLPYHDLQFQVKPKKLEGWPAWILRHSLKAPNHVIQDTLLILTQPEKTLALVHQDPKNMLIQGLFLRETGQLWKMRILIAIVQGVVADPSITKEDRTKAVFDTFMVYNTFIQENDMEALIDMKPILNGNEVRQLLGVSGAEIKKTLDKVIEWQILNRKGTKEECKQYLLESKAE